MIELPRILVVWLVLQGNRTKCGANHNLDTFLNTYCGISRVVKNSVQRYQLKLKNINLKVFDPNE